MRIPMVTAALAMAACSNRDHEALLQRTAKLEERLSALEKRDAATEATVREIGVTLAYAGVVDSDMRATVGWWCGEARCFRDGASCQAVLSDCAPRAFAYCALVQLDPKSPPVTLVDCSPTIAGCEARGVGKGTACVRVQ